MKVNSFVDFEWVMVGLCIPVVGAESGSEALAT